MIGRSCAGRSVSGVHGRRPRRGRDDDLAQQIADIRLTTARSGERAINLTFGDLHTWTKARADQVAPDNVDRDEIGKCLGSDASFAEDVDELFRR